MYTLHIQMHYTCMRRYKIYLLMSCIGEWCDHLFKVICFCWCCIPNVFSNGQEKKQELKHLQYHDQPRNDNLIEDQSQSIKKNTKKQNKQEIQLRNKDREIYCLKTTNDALQNQNSQLLKKNHLLTNQGTILKKKLKDNENFDSNIQQSIIQNLTKDMEIYKNKISQLEEERKKKNASNINSKISLKEGNSSQEQIKKQELVKMSLQSQKQKEFHAEINKLKKNQQILLKKSTSYEEKIEKLKKELLTLENLKQQNEKKLQSQIISLKEQFIKLDKRNRQKQQNEKKLQSQILTLKENQKNIFKEVKTKVSSQQKIKHESQIKSLSATFNIKMQQMEKQLTQKNNQISTIKSSYNPNQKFFRGKILTFTYQRDFIIKQIQQYTHNKVIDTDLIYSFDEKNSTNIHHYVDNIPNTVLLLKTSSEAIIGVFARSAFSPMPDDNKETFIFSVSQQKIFPLKNKESNPLQYDHYYLIYGNSEVRIKVNELKVYSNLGIQSGKYNSKGLTSKEFLMNEEKQITLKGYEIFKVTFS